ncbi:MAG: hypothetical protein ACYTBZ_14310 [Planctomycetota bacterium]|jgi:hypothetical protein
MKDSKVVMRMLKAVTLLTVFFAAAPVYADGFLWIAGEFAPPTSIYRYNLSNGTLDLVVQPQHPGGGPLDPATDVYNNLPYDGTHLYIGVDDGELFAKADPCTAVVSSAGAYNPGTAPAASREDGAYHIPTGTLWRATDNSFLIENDTSGNVLNIRPALGVQTFNGLEWIGNTLYATGRDTKVFGTVTIAGPVAIFNQLPLAGIPPGHHWCGLALDQNSGILYMTTTTLQNAYLWTINLGALTATLVENLTVNEGYPAGFVLPDALGWVPPCVIEAELDIKPGSCPNPLNTNTQGKGRLPMAILGTDTFDVSDIDPNSISIAGAVFPLPVPVIEDAGTPFDGEECDCHELEGDGIDDLVLHFSRRDIIIALGLGALARDTVVPITVEGELLDGTPFEATDCIRIIARED